MFNERKYARQLSDEFYLSISLFSLLRRRYQGRHAMLLPVA